MLLVKKRLWDQNILLLPLILSLLRIFPDLYFGTPRSAVSSDYHPSSVLTQGNNHFGRRNVFSDESVNLSPKSLEYLFQQHQNDIVNDLTSLGQFSERHRRVIEAYVLRLVDNPYRIENFSLPSTSEPCERQREAPPLQRSLSSASDLSSADLADLNIDQYLSIDLRTRDEELYPFEYQSEDKSLLDEAIGLSLSMEDPFLPLPPDPADGALTQEDVDLIEILWKQDIDLGVEKSIFHPVPPGEVGGNLTLSKHQAEPEDGKKKEDKNEEPKEQEDDPWAGLNYIIDSETGEHLLVEDLEERPAGGAPTEGGLSPSVLERFSEEDLIGEDLGIDLLELATGSEKRQKSSRKESEGEASTSGVSDVSSVSDGELERSDALTDALEASLDSMLESGMHHRSYPVRVPLVRGVNADQRWQELAHLFTLPTADHHTSGHYHYPGYQGIAVPHAVYPNLANLHHDQRSALLHNATLAAPALSVAELQGNGSYPPAPQSAGTASHLSSAVAVSLNLTSNGTADHTAGNNPAPTGVPAFKMEVTPDPGYYQQPGVEIGNGHQEGFFSSLLNDDDLQMMDVGMPEGAYGVRMIDANSNVQGGAHGVADSRQGPVAGGEAPLMRPESDWAEHHYLGYSSSLRNPGNGSIGSLGGSESRNPPQKKHQFYGKRFVQDNPSGENGYFSGSVDPATDPLLLSNDLKYPYPDYPGHTLDMRSNALDALHHNHSYSMNRSQEELAYRPVSRDKRATSSAMSSRSSTDGEVDQISRDEKRARALNIPITVDDIINLPMDEFNERLAKYDLSETQLSLIRDIRRRGKNKVAAQNCRKRKLDQILGLADELRRVKERKIRLVREREMLLAEKSRVKERFAMLHRHVFQSLRDPDGNPYSPYEYSLQQSADGSVVLVPRTGIRAEQEIGEPGPSSVIRKSGDSGRNATA